MQDMLKVLAALQDAVLAEDFERKAWEKAVRGAPDLLSLRDALGELQTAVRDDRLSQHFARSPLLVKGAWMETGMSLSLGAPSLLLPLLQRSTLTIAHLQQTTS